MNIKLSITNTNVDLSDIKSIPAEVIVTTDIGNDNVIFMKCEKTHKVLLVRDAKTSYENITLLLANLGLDLSLSKFPKTSV